MNLPRWGAVRKGAAWHLWRGGRPRCGSPMIGPPDETTGFDGGDQQDETVEGEECEFAPSIEGWKKRPKALWRLPTVKQVTGLGRSSIYERMGKGTFPATVELDGGPMVAWVSLEIIDWVEAQIEASRGGEAA